MKKLGWVGVAVAGVLLLSGCGEAEPDAAPGAASAQSADVQAESADAPVEAVDLTAEGEACDSQAGDDFPCLVVAPDLAVLNMTASPRAYEPLSSMPDAGRIALAHDACDALAAGETYETSILVESSPEAEAIKPALNNYAIFSAGAAAYCPDFAEQWVQDALKAASAG